MIGIVNKIKKNLMFAHEEVIDLAIEISLEFFIGISILFSFQKMSVGVPKVVWQIPDDEEESWVDLYNRLYRNRYLFIIKEINEDTLTNVGGLIIFLNIEDPSKDLFLFITSRGGGVGYGLAIYNLITALPADVNTLALGITASIATLILIGGTKMKRAAFPSARVMIHQPKISEYKGRWLYTSSEMYHIFRMYEMILKIYIEKTSHTLWTVVQDLRRDVYMSAEEAKEYGIVDSIVNKEFLKRYLI